MKILVACEESQAVTIELRKLGHEAYSCDIEDCSGGHPEWHIQGDVLEVMNGCCTFKTMDEKMHCQGCRWDMLVAFPPCTYLSNAGATWLYPQKGVLNKERYKKGLEGKAFFMNFYNAVCDKIAVENPIPSLVYELPKRSQIIQPYQFGEPYSKKTCLWLKGLPLLQPTNILTKYVQLISTGTASKKGLKEKDGMTHGSKLRSKTFPGIAKAMAEQWTVETKDKEQQISFI